MAVVFGSEQWAEGFWAAIRGSDEYRRAGATWVHGVCALVIEAEPDKNFPESKALWLDLHEGEARDVRLVSVEEATKAPFVIYAPYTRWKQISRGELDPIKGIMQGRLRLKGDLPTIVRHVEASKALVNCSAAVDSEFPDEVGAASNAS